MVQTNFYQQNKNDSINSKVSEKIQEIEKSAIIYKEKENQTL